MRFSERLLQCSRGLCIYSAVMFWLRTWNEIRMFAYFLNGAAPAVIRKWGCISNDIPRKVKITLMHQKYSLFTVVRDSNNYFCVIAVQLDCDCVRLCSLTFLCMCFRICWNILPRTTRTSPSCRTLCGYLRTSSPPSMRRSTLAGPLSPRPRERCVGLCVITVYSADAHHLKYEWGTAKKQILMNGLWSQVLCRWVHPGWRQKFHPGKGSQY